MEPPIKRNASIVWTAVVFAMAFLIQCIGMTRVVNVYDECLELFAAVRVLHGDLPYRDFWTMYGPAQFYVLAGLFKVFGISVLVARLYNAFTGACVVVLLFVIARRFVNPALAAFASFWAVLWATGVLFISYEFPTYPALALTLASVLILVPVFEGRAEHRAGRFGFPFALLMCGFCVGMVTLFRHDFGFYVFICELLMLLTRDVGQTSRRIGTPEIRRRNVRQCAWYLCGMALILLPTAILIFRYVPLHDLYFDLIFVPARIYPKVRSLPFPKLPFLLSCLKHRVWLGTEQAIDYFPVFVSITSFIYLAATRRTCQHHPAAGKAARKLFVLLTLLLVLMTVKGLVRVSPVQLIQAILLAILVLTILIAKTWHAHRIVRFLCVGCIFAAALPTFTVAAVVAGRSLANTKDALGMQVNNFPDVPGGVLHDACHVQPGLKRLRCFYLEPFEIQAIQYIQAHTSPADTIYVGAGRHDRLWLNNLAFYFVSERMSGTKWHDLHPGIETTAPIQQEMVSDLLRTHTRYVILENSWDNEDEPNQSRLSSGVTILDNFIASHYQKVAAFGPISILQLR